MITNHMRELKAGSILFLAATLLLIAACSKKSVNTEEPAYQENTEEIISYLASQGFDKQQIVFENDRVIVEKDIILSFPELQQRIADWKTAATEQRRHTYIVSNSYNSNITIYIDPAVPSNWRTAIQGAVNNWNAVPSSRLGMSIVSSQSGAHCRVFMGYEAANWIARAYLPSSSGRPGVSVEINSNYNSLAASQKLFAITHEFGHTIGFHHTNQTSGIHIPGTPTSDPNSVMNSFVLPWNGFTSADVLATQILYPQ
ncbi:M57 family metalloprotease [Longitalea luteola]|uniref:M57 family metalloprotease n=1 Tax=Longitalea luteola TaxID=2812563 RepID=UPI001A972244|nr:M57 family metalloprotease [Longitalea luteola]